MYVTPWVYHGDCFKMTITRAQAYFQNIFHSFKVVYLLPLIKTSNLKLIINDWQVKGDVRVIFYQKMIGGRLFYVCFNTAFIRNGLLQVNFISYNFAGLGFPLQRSRVGKKITNPCFKGVRIRFRIECWSELASLTCSSRHEIWIKLGLKADRYVALPSAWSCSLLQLIQTIQAR